MNFKTLVVSSYKRELVQSCRKHFSTLTTVEDLKILLKCIQEDFGPAGGDVCVDYASKIFVRYLTCPNAYTPPRFTSITTSMTQNLGGACRYAL